MLLIQILCLVIYTQIFIELPDILIELLWFFNNLHITETYDCISIQLQNNIYAFFSFFLLFSK